MKILRRILPLMIFFVLFIPENVGAQQGVVLDEVNISLMPEYDRPMMLVIYNMTLSPEVALPNELAFTIPAAAGEPHAVAERGVDGVLYNIDFSREVRGDRALIRFTSTTPEIWIEYYDPSLSVADAQRNFSYSWPGDYAVNNLTLTAQEPISSTEFTTTPDLGTAFQRTDGFTYHEKQIGPVGQGEMVNLDLSYQKFDEALSITSLYPEPSGVISQDTEGRVNLANVLPWVAGVLGLILIGGGLYWLFRVRNSAPVTPASTKRGRRGISEPAVEITSESKLYCHVCGKLAASGDVYCRSCGTRLRNGES